MRNEPLLAWQRRLYPDGHATRVNLLLHALTQPIFVAGLVAIPLGIALAMPIPAIGGLLAMIVAVVAQGRGHRMEPNPPAPFLGPFDVVRRIFAEQLVTFPRFVFSGGFARAWRDAAR